MTDKLFTAVRVDVFKDLGTASSTSGRWRAADYTPALVFGYADGRALTAEEELDARRHASEFFRGGMYVSSRDLSDGGVQYVVTSAPLDGYLPDTTVAGQALEFCTAGEPDTVLRLSMEERYRSCRELVRVLGCKTCEHVGVTCYRRSAPALPTYVKTRWPDFAEEKKTLGEWQYTSPFLCLPDTKPARRSRYHYNSGVWERYGLGEISLTNVEDNREELSARAKEGAATKRFKREECANCPAACARTHGCAGRLMPEEEAYAKALEELLPPMLEKYAPWQLWTLMRFGGRKGKDGRKTVVLAWASTEGVVYRRTREDVYKPYTDATYETAAQRFELPRTEAEALRSGCGQRPPDKAVALYLLFGSKRVKFATSGWGHGRFTAAAEVQGADVFLYGSGESRVYESGYRGFTLSRLADVVTLHGRDHFHWLRTQGTKSGQ